MRNLKEQKQLLNKAISLFDKISLIIEKEETDFELLQKLAKSHDKCWDQGQIVGCFSEAWHALDNAIARIRGFAEDHF
jgi:hypothetical protein